jgi:TPR repeat protein
MKTNRLMLLLLLWSSAPAFQLEAQRLKADPRPLQEVRAKAEAGDADSQGELGLRYTKGEGVAKDPAEAVKWFRKAAEQNFVTSQWRLGLALSAGHGVARDPVEGYKWLLLAAKQGDDDAKRDMARLAKELTPEQVAEAQKQANAFKSR